MSGPKKWTKAAMKKKALSIMAEREKRMGSNDPMSLTVFSRKEEGLKPIRLPKDTGCIFQRTFGTIEGDEYLLQRRCPEITAKQFESMVKLNDDKRWGRLLTRIRGL